MKKFVLLVLATFILFLSGCEQNEGSKCVTVDVLYVEEEINESFDVCTDALVLEELLIEQDELLSPEINESSFGSYLAGLYGYNFETEGMSYYWSIFVNDEYASVGISDLEVTDGDTYSFEAMGY